jgi:hypothetical protein
MGKHEWEPRIDWMVDEDGHAIPRWYTAEQIIENRRKAEEARWGILAQQAADRIAAQERREEALAEAEKSIRHLTVLNGMAMLLFIISLVVVPDPTARAGVAVALLISIGTWTWCWNRANSLYEEL